ncbi:MAG: hypothetical protein U0R69_04425 [Gaiellales bacterium]
MSSVRLEREVERLEDGRVVDLIAAQQLVGGDPLAADPLLLFVEDMVADPVLVVGGEELAFFVVEPCDFGARAGGFLVGDRGEAVDVALDRGADALAFSVGELDGGVVALGRRFDRFGAVVGLVADAGGSAAADEVVVEAAASAGAGRRARAFRKQRRRGPLELDRVAGLASACPRPRPQRSRGAPEHAVRARGGVLGRPGHLVRRLPAA